MLLGWLCALVVVVLILAAFGHAVWLVVEMLLRDLLGIAKRAESRVYFPYRSCPSCAEEVIAGYAECSHCHLNLEGGLAWSLAKVRSASSEIGKLHEAGVIDDSTASLVEEQLQKRLKSFLGKSRVTKAERLAPTLKEPEAANGPDMERLPAPRPAKRPARRPEPVMVAVAPPLHDEAPATSSSAKSVSSDRIPDKHPPKRGSVVAAFMEERNILWGELVGGLLIVGCSIALVVTLWRGLEAIPYFPFLLSASITLALYGAGQYTLHHWKLTATSRGLLVISLLLTPLNMLLLSDSITRGEASALVDVAVKFAAIALFGWIVRGGGRDVLIGRPEWRWWLAVAVVGAPATQLLPTSWIPEAGLDLPAWLALGCFALGSVVVLRDRSAVRASGMEPPRLEYSIGTALLVFVGFAVFALAAAWGLHVARSLDVAERVKGLALPLALASVPIIEAGLLVYQRTRVAGLRAIGTGVALAGFVAMTGAEAAAWPDPLRILLASLATGLFLTRIAFREALPWAHAGALPALAFASIVGYHGLAGEWSIAGTGRTVANFLPAINNSWPTFDPTSGVLLAVFGLFAAAIAELLARGRLKLHATSYALSALAAGILGLFLVTVNGWEYPLRASVTCGFCSVGLLASNSRWKFRVLAQAGLWLVLVGTLWLLQAVIPGRFPIWGFVLSVEAIGWTALALALKENRLGAANLIRQAACDLAIAGVVASAFFALMGIGHISSSWQMGTLLSLAIALLALTRPTASPIPTYLAAAAALLGIMHLTTYACGCQPVVLALLIAFLTHATLVIVAALRSSHRLLYSLPLWRSSFVPIGLAAILLFVLPTEQVLVWAGCAVWLGILLLIHALKWNDPRLFSAFQLALALASIYCGVAWVETQEWRFTSQLGFVDPAALHVYSIALGFFGLAWAVANGWAERARVSRLRSRGESTVRSKMPHLRLRLAIANRLARQLWLEQPLPMDRFITAVVVVFQLLLAIIAINPVAIIELTPIGQSISDLEAAELPRAFTPSAWLALGMLSITLLAYWRSGSVGGDSVASKSSSARTEILRGAAIIGLLLLFLTAPILWAGTFAHEIASASALRWGLAGGFVLGSGLMAARTPLRRWLATVGLRLEPSLILHLTSLLLLAIPAAVVVMISAHVADLGINAAKLRGPLPESLFATIGSMASNLVPLALVIVGLTGTAVRERLPGYAFVAGIVFTATLTAGYALHIITGGEALGRSETIIAWMLVVGGCSIWANSWLAAERFIPGGRLLTIQSRLGQGVLILFSSFTAILIVSKAGHVVTEPLSVLGRYGWLALALAASSAMWQSFRHEAALKFHVLASAAAIAGVLAACAAHPWSEGNRWLSFHALSGAWAALAIGLAFVTRKTGLTSLWLDGLSAVLAILAIRGGWSDPTRPWAPAGLALVATATLAVAGHYGRSLVRVYLTLFLTVLVSTLIWLPSNSDTLYGFLLANAASAAGLAIVWSIVFVRDAEARWHDVADVARGIALVFLGIGLIPTLLGQHGEPHWLTWGSIAVSALALAAALWDVKAAIARGGLFAVGVLAVLLAVSETTMGAVSRSWLTEISLAAYLVLIAGLALYTSRAKPGFLRLPLRGDSWLWLLIAQAIVGGIVLVIALQIGLINPELLTRLSSPASVLLLVAAAVLLLEAMPRWSVILRYSSLGLGVLAPALAALTLPDPSGIAPWLQRSAWLVVALSLSGIAASEWSGKLEGNWRTPLRHIGGIGVGLGLLLLIVSQIQQVPAFNPVTRRTPLEPAAILATLATLIGLIVIVLRWALNGERDPLRLPISQRAAYVYIAELLIVSLFIHIRFNVPELFVGQMVKYWTFAVMVLAYIGIGLAELFERRSLPVLSMPLRRTGVLLPLVPLLAFWAKPPAALALFASDHAPGLSPFLGYLQNLPQHFDTYAWLWSLAGMLYGLVALSRQSFGWALVGALAVNAALWSMLTHEGIPFLLHPQAWVIPLALIVLVSEHVNRRRLSRDVSNGLRYLGVSMIYVASSADMFIAGVGSSVWLPVLLAVLCVAGVLFGILVRVRAFLFLGIGFLLLDVFSMIWYAAVDRGHTWVWYVSGILLGIAILTLFAVFEKRKKRQLEDELRTERVHGTSTLHYLDRGEK